MKTSIFFNEINSVVNCALYTTFDYSVNRNKDFYEIILSSEPTKEVEDICEKNGFSFKKTILHKNEGGKMVPNSVWVIRPVNANDIEYVEK